MKKEINSENEFRITIEDSELKSVFKELKAKDFSLKKISEQIGVDFKGPLYRGYSMSEISFRKLETLVGRDISHIIKGLNQEDGKELKRIDIKKSILNSVFNELKERGISINEISKNIGTQIGNTLRLGYSINEDSFKKLELLYGKEIPYIIKKTKEKINHKINLKENQKLAEMIGIILGDGHLHKKGEKSYKDSVLSISLNRIDEKNYVKYVKEFMEKMFKVEPEVFPRKDSKGVDLKLYGDGLVDTLVSKGLKTGDKVENQVIVPDWIKKDRLLVVGGLKGLTDTDGSIYVASRNKTININFRNASRPLVKDFKEMCKSLDINAGKISPTEWISQKTGKKLIGYQTQIQAKKDVKSFLEIIKPMKWEIKKQEISEKLKELDTSIEEALAYKFQ